MLADAACKPRAVRQPCANTSYHQVIIAMLLLHVPQHSPPSRVRCHVETIVVGKDALSEMEMSNKKHSDSADGH